MGNLLKHSSNIINGACLVAAAVNVGLFAFSVLEGYRGLQLLSLINLFLLSFRLLRVSNET